MSNDLQKHESGQQQGHDREERRRVAQQPAMRVELYATSVEKLLRDAQQERIAVEAEFAIKIDGIKNRVAAEKASLNKSIQEMERQLGELRHQWTKLSDDGDEEVERAEAEAKRQMEAQDTIVRAHRAMLETLSGSGH